MIPLGTGLTDSPQAGAKLGYCNPAMLLEVEVPQPILMAGFCCVLPTPACVQCHSISAMKLSLM
jgi:hypothetical protein